MLLRKPHCFIGALFGLLSVGMGVLSVYMGVQVLLARLPLFLFVESWGLFLQVLLVLGMATDVCLALSMIAYLVF